MERTPYQEKIIKRYYENKPEIMRQKLSELVTELYLAETPKKSEQLWKRVATALANVNVPQSAIDALVNGKSPAVLARFIETKLESYL